MIPIDRPYTRVNDLAKKDKSGYTSPDEYNRHIRDAQNILMSFYIDQLERHQKVPENLNPFIKRTDILELDGPKFPMPTDYRYTLEVYSGYWTLTDEGKAAINVSTVSYVGPDEVGRRRSSKIRKTPFYYYEGNQLWIENGEVGQLRYIRKAPPAVYGYTEDTENDRIVFDTGSSTDLEWLEQDETNIIDILLFMKGIETKDNSLIQWVAGKKQMYEPLNR